MREECGIFAINYYKDSFEITSTTISGLNKLQHRGQDSAGIAYIDNKNIIEYKKDGLVKDVFKNFKNVKSNKCIGHVRYSTSKKNDMNRCIQPFTSKNKLGQFSLAHNGHLHNLDKSTISDGYKYVSDSDFIKEYIKNSKLNTWDDILIDLMIKIPGVYNLVILTIDSIYVLRDRFGMRPLCIGLNKKGYYVSSESNALSDCDRILDVDPGQVIKISDNIYPIYNHPPENLRCIFEYIYFSNKDSIIDRNNISVIRENYGKMLAKQDVHLFPTDTIVVGSPNSGILAGKGYAKYSKLEYKQLMIKNPNYNRSFIMPDQESRINVCNNKFKIDTETFGSIENKIIILVDDSIVRGNTIQSVIKLFKKHNVKELHIRSASPPLKHPCYFGIDMPTYDEFIANKIPSYNNLAKFLGVNSVDYISKLNLLSVMKEHNKTLNFCTACFDGKYNNKLMDW